jgi:TatD DNase family protein
VRLVDSHAHLNADRFTDDVDVVLSEARQAGVERLLVPGWNVRSSERAVELAEAHDWLDASVGIHPHDAARTDAAGWGRIVELARHPKVVAIGETGLDYDRLFSPVEDQLANLRRNLALALETGRPAILHCRSRAGQRDAQDALRAELEVALGVSASAAPPAGEHPPAVLHSFSGPVDHAEAMLALGCAVSFSGLVFRHGEEASADVVRIVPADRLLVETDSPFLSPPGGPRGRNEPAWVRVTAAWMAERRAEDPEYLGGSLVAAYDRTFGWIRPGPPA